MVEEEQKVRQNKEEEEEEEEGENSAVETSDVLKIVEGDCVEELCARGKPAQQRLGFEKIESLLDLPVSRGKTASLQGSGG